MVIEQAKKELEKLEINHPNSFQSLKFELRTFISQLEEEEEEKLSSPQYYSTAASTHGILFLCTYSASEQSI